MVRSSQRTTVDLVSRQLVVNQHRLKPQKQTMLLILGGHFKVAKTGHY